MHLKDPNIDFPDLHLYLRELNEVYGGGNELKIALTVLDDERFPLWSGASKPEQHHYGKHGLLLHTYEVARLAFSSNETLGSPVDRRELYYSALFHDAGKMFDYEPTKFDKTEWTGTDHKRRIHHISRSALIWSEAVKKWGSEETVATYHDRVLHNILSHHGCREWGSPVSPATKAAWILHTCDHMSARCYETL